MSTNCAAIFVEDLQNISVCGKSTAKNPDQGRRSRFDSMPLTAALRSSDVRPLLPVKLDRQHRPASAQLADRVGADAPWAGEEARTLDERVLDHPLLDTHAAALSAAASSDRARTSVLIPQSVPRPRITRGHRPIASRNGVTVVYLL